MSEAVFDRVRKLLALATSPNAHEAAAATARAQALIARHRLEGWLADEARAQDDPIDDDREHPLEAGKRLRKWKVALACTLADANGCLAYTLDRGADQAIVLVGRASDRAAVRELWDWSVRRIEWLSATHGVGRDKRWHEAFRIGVVDAFAERLQRVDAEAREELPDGAALAVIERRSAAHDDRLQRFVEDRLRLRPGRGIRVDARAWARGREAANELALPPR